MCQIVVLTHRLIYVVNLQVYHMSTMSDVDVGTDSVSIAFVVHDIDTSGFVWHIEANRKRNASRVSAESGTILAIRQHQPPG